MKNDTYRWGAANRAQAGRLDELQHRSNFNIISRYFLRNYENSKLVRSSYNKRSPHYIPLAWDLRSYGLLRSVDW